jgi:hypothetical protein
MTIPYEQTKVLIELILNVQRQDARDVLRYNLQRMKYQEPKFYASVIEHGPGMAFTSEQWFDFLSKIPTQAFRAERQLMDKLSESQQERLPPPTIG